MAEPVPGEKRYLVRVRRFNGTAHAMSSHDATSLWDAVLIAMEHLDDGCEIVSIQKLVTTLEPLAASERDTVELLTGGKIHLGE